MDDSGSCRESLPYVIGFVLKSLFLPLFLPSLPILVLFLSSHFLSNKQGDTKILLGYVWLWENFKGKCEGKKIGRKIRNKKKRRKKKS